MKKQVKIGLFVAVMTSFVGGQASANLIANGSFEDGNSAWQTGVGGNATNLTASFVGKWTAYSTTDTRMDVVDAFPLGVTGQSGNFSALSQSSSYISFIQVVDVSGLGDISNQDWALSLDTAVITNGVDSAPSYARAALFGFDDFTSGVTVDLTGKSAADSVENATYIWQTANRSNGDSEFDTVTINQNKAAMSDFNYLAVVLTADSNVLNSNSNFVAWDDVSLTVIPEPATMGLVGVFGGAVLFIRRRFTI